MPPTRSLRVVADRRVAGHLTIQLSERSDGVRSDEIRMAYSLQAALCDVLVN
jgi:hypothetical protein